MIKFDVYVKKTDNTQKEVNSKSKELLAVTDSLEKKKSEEKSITSFYEGCVKYLLTNLPLVNQFLIDVKYLHPNTKSKIAVFNSLARVTEIVWQCLGTSAQNFIEVKPNSNVSELKYKVKL